MTVQRPPEVPFYVRDMRAMVSLGPLAPTKFCTYSCPFCYVHAGFRSYASMSVDDIAEWLRANREPFDVIYVSGDTDSFAPPRTSLGISLLRTLANEFDVDLLFTTRAAFRPNDFDALSAISEQLRSKGKLLFGCVSISQLNSPHLEPHPIPSPAVRFGQLERFRECGLVAVMAMRPFLPNVSVAEYLRIVDAGHSRCDVILGEHWYADGAGLLERMVLGAPAAPQVAFATRQMDFDDNGAIWKVYEAMDVETAVSARCQSLSIPFFMRSRPAIEWARRERRPTV